MIDKDFAHQFAAEWIDAWNKHDLPRILSYYAGDIELSSPAIIKIAREPSGILRGKGAVSSYWAKTFLFFPDLHFDLVSTLIGVDSISLQYNGARGLASEIFHFNSDMKIVRSFVHYL